MVRSVFVVGVLALAASSAGAEFRFAVPAGWVDLSPGKPLAPGAPVALVIRARRGPYVAYAVNPRSYKDAAPETMNAVIERHVFVADEAALRQYVAALPERCRLETAGARREVQQSGVVSVQGVPCLRLRILVTASGGSQQMLQYVIPGGESTAALTFASSTPAFSRDLPVFAAAAQQTRGAVAAPALARVGQALLANTPLGRFTPEDRVKLLGLAGALLGAGLGMGVALLVRRSRRSSV